MGENRQDDPPAGTPGNPVADVETLLRRTRTDDPETRGDAVRAVLEIARSDPARVGACSDELVAAIAWGDDEYQVELSHALFLVGVGAPETLLGDGHALVDLVTQVRPKVRTNVARPLAEVAVRDQGPVLDRFPLVTMLLDDGTDGVRRSAAWAIEQAVLQHAGGVAEPVPWVEEVADSLPDGHDPVDKHLCRTLAHCERAGADLDLDPRDVGPILERGSAPTRTAATALLGAMGSRAPRDYLQTAMDEDPSTNVRRHARCALRETALPDSVPDSALDPVECPNRDLGRELDLDEWVVVDPPTDGPVPRGGRYTGRVVMTEAGSEPDGDGDDCPRTVARCWNRFEEYCVDLGVLDGAVYAAVHDDRQSHGPQFWVEDVSRITGGSDLVSLLYATGGDELAFAVEGAPHTAVVDATDPDDGTLRARNEDSGTVVRFRPTTRPHRRVEFEAGRGFAARSIRILGDGGRSYVNADPDRGPWVFPRWDRG